MEQRVIAGATVAALLLLGPCMAAAQWSPDASASLGAGMGAMALGQSTLSGTRQLGPPASPGNAGLSPTMQRYCARWPNEGVCRANRAQARPAAAPGAAGPSPAERERLEREYRARLRRDGKPAADRWLAATAREMGRREGEAARAR